jgi:hypothetical protein
MYFSQRTTEYCVGPRQNLGLLRVRVENPVSWYMELQDDSHE